MMTDFYCRSVGEKFDLSKSSLNDCVRRVIKILNNIAGEIIKWPKGERLITCKETFNCLGDAPIPGIVGAIDGTYIYIKQPNLQVFFFVILGLDFTIFMNYVISDYIIFYCRKLLSTTNVENCSMLSCFKQSVIQI